MKAELKTLNDCKDEVAKKYGYMNWSSLITFRSDLVVLFVDELSTLYARIQIEKDRERVKKSVRVKANIEGNELDVASYETYEGCKFTASIESIDSTPIELD